MSNILNIISFCQSEFAAHDRREKELTGQLQLCQQALLESRRENALLRQKIDLLVKRVFGSSSEQLHPGQLELLMPLPASSTVAAAVAARKRSVHATTRWPSARTGCRRTCRWWRK